VRSDGQLLAWGYNGDGQLGGGITPDRLTPVAVSGFSDTKFTAGSYFYSLAVRGDGGLWGWGRSPNGELAQFEDFVTVEHPMTNANNFARAAAGGFHSIGLTAQGEVRTWGRNLVGAGGTGVRVSNWLPLPVLGLGGTG